MDLSNSLSTTEAMYQLTEAAQEGNTKLSQGALEFVVDSMGKVSTCPSCGEPTRVSAKLTQLFCPNPLCGAKPVSRLVDVAKYLNIPFIGPATAEKIVKSHGSNHMKIFTLDPDQDYIYQGVSGTANDAVMAKVVEIRSEPRTLADLVRNCALPGLKDQATKLLKGYPTFTEFYNDLHASNEAADQVDFVQTRLGFKTRDISIQAIKVRGTLLDFEEVLKEIEPYFNILSTDTSLPTKTLAMSGSMGSYDTKASFFSQAALKAAGSFNLEQSGSVTKETDYLITYETDTQKVQKAMRDDYKTEILTPEEFMSKFPD